MIKGSIKNNNNANLVGQISPKQSVSAEIGRGDHSELLNNLLPDQHNIDSVIGLKDALQDLEQAAFNIRGLLAQYNVNNQNKINLVNNNINNLTAQLAEEISRATNSESNLLDKNNLLDSKLDNTKQYLYNKILEEKQILLDLIEDLQFNAAVGEIQISEKFDEIYLTMQDLENDISDILATKADLEDGKIKEDQLPYLNIICSIE